MYRLATEEQLDETAVWYVNDEVASAMRHSDTPGVATAPFLHMPGGTMASAVRWIFLYFFFIDGARRCSFEYQNLSHVS